MKYKLRTFVLVVLFCCIAFAFARFRIEDQRDIASSIEDLGGKAIHTHVVERRDPLAPKWLLDHLGIETFEGLAQIELHGTDVKDVTFLSKLSGVQRLYLDRTQVDDLTALQGMDDLFLLSIDFTPVEDLSPLADLQELEILSISDSAVSSFKPLHGLKNLKTLYARRTEASASEFEALRRALPNCTIQN